MMNNFQTNTDNDDHTLAESAATSVAEEPQMLTPKMTPRGQENLDDTLDQAMTEVSESGAWNDDSRLTEVNKSSVSFKNAKTYNESENDGETDDTDDGWLDELDTALHKQGYSGL